MAKFSQTKKWKKRTLTVLAAALATSFSLGLFAACAQTPDDEKEESKVAPTDTQVIKNGNFEFYSDKLVDNDANGKPLEKVGIISTPDSWTFTSGSPSSEKQSGVIDTRDWNYYAKTGGSPYLTTFTKGEEEVTTFADVATAVAHWKDQDVSAYDRLKFLDLFKDEIDALPSGSDEKKALTELNYSVDFDDVETLVEDLEKETSGDVLELHKDATTGEDKKDNTSVLMIHNSKTSDDGILGTAQYYTSSTTVTLNAGTAAKVSVWVRTDSLRHYKDVELSARGGAYIGVTNTVGGTTLDQMQIYNIHTKGEWQQYTLYVRASTFATSTFRIVLGLGQGTSDDKYYAVDGYAFFDDVACEIVKNEEFDAAVLEDDAPKASVGYCTADDEAEEKRFDYDVFKPQNKTTFALDLYAGFEADSSLFDDAAKAALTVETSGSKTYSSADVDASLEIDEKDYAEITTLAGIEAAASGNAYLKKVFDADLKDKYPFDADAKIVMLLSSNGAAYTQKLNAVTLASGERKLISFFVKTSKIQSGLSGAGAQIVDGTTKTTISAFDSTTVATVDIDSKDESKKDIYKGWVQCFFFVENDTDAEKTFTLELTYGPTTIVGTNKFSYGDGYAAFANFEVKDLSKTEYSYASTGDRAKKVSLTGEVKETKQFDSVSATAEKDIETAPALPANYRAVLGGSDYVQKNETSVPNAAPAGVYAGLVNYDYAENYFSDGSDWMNVLKGSAADAQSWWKSTFDSARQPLVIVNASNEAQAYGYFGEMQTLSSSSYRRISMRVKVSANATAHVYLTDVTTDGARLLRPDLPAVTYWYDDDGNVVNMDPSADNYKKDGEVLYNLAPNGLYTKAGDENGKYYANLSNYETVNGNLVTSDGAIAFYGKDGKFYAYYDEEAAENAQYTVEVGNLADDPDLVAASRYRYDSELRGTEIVVSGTTTTDWVTVNFYLHAGNEAKDYRIEVFSGSRDGKEKSAANSYVLVDNFASEDASSDYSTALEETVAAAKDAYNEKNNLKLGDEGFLGTNDNLPSDYADYYTFTFFDSPSYLRYDETTDTEENGNPWIDYVQSSYSETLSSLYFEDSTTGHMPRYSFFLDYSATDVTVTPATPDTDDDADADADEGETDPANFWLLLSSGLLAIVLIGVIAVIVVRRLIDRFKKPVKVKPKKTKRVKPVGDD